MDVWKWGCAALLGAAVIGSLVVRDQPTSAVAQLPLPAECGEAHAGHDGPTMQEQLDQMAAAADEGHAALLQTMEPMHSEMMRGMMAADFQLAFVCGMIPHHQGAVEMAQVAQQHSNDPWVLMFAQEIITSQQKEVLEMRAWLARQTVP